MPLIPSKTGIRSAEGALFSGTVSEGSSRNSSEIGIGKSSARRFLRRLYGSTCFFLPNNLRTSPRFTAQLRAFDRRMERAKGVEPLPETWKAPVLPLNYTRIFLLPLSQCPHNAPFGACSWLFREPGLAPVSQHTDRELLVNFSQKATNGGVKKNATNAPESLL